MKTWERSRTRKPNEVAGLFTALEKEFGVDIPDAEQERITTVGQAIAYLKAEEAGSE
ncbi:hypothetical protein [Streptomyces sp. NPDC051909]|uniref:hypothetical protein n=1 Tax=Streptomyces sp. NPDC051909 TaxID=3154944 RepID=UPI00341E77AF